jgi:tetratricopeptide (TPR) repeat protein
MRGKLLLGLLLIAATLGVYWGVWTFEFVNFDDPIYVSENPHVRSGISRENAKWAFASLHEANWIPLTWLSLMLDAQIHGDFAGGFHLTNLCLHIANALLLFALLATVTAARWKSAFVAAAFAIHPLHVESVAWITERKDVLSTFFGLAALLAYARYAEKPRRSWYLLSLAAFGCSLLAKQMLVTLPMLLLLLDYWPLRRLKLSAAKREKSSQVADAAHEMAAAEQQPHSSRILGNDKPAKLACPTRSVKELLLEKVPFLGLTALFCMVALAGQRYGNTVASLTDLSFGTRCANAVLAYATYIIKTVWPQGLAPYYPYSVEAISWVEVSAAAIFLSTCTLWAVLQRNRRPYLLVGWLWYLGTCVPVIGLVQIGTQQTADRYTYFPIVGLFIAASWYLPSVIPAGIWRQRLLPVVATSMLVLFAVTARQQTSYWKNSLTLWERARDVTAANLVACFNYCDALLGAERIDEAVSQARVACRVAPNRALAHLALGRALTHQRQRAEAIQAFEKALQLEPHLADAHAAVGHVRLQQRRYAEASVHLQKAVQLKPESLAPHLDLAAALTRQNKAEEAASHCRTALEIDPNHAEAHLALGQSLAALGKQGEASACFQRALDRDPGLAAAHAAMGDLHVEQGDTERAVRCYRQVLVFEPKSVYAHIALGDLSAQQQELETAAGLYAVALELVPESAEAHKKLGNVLAIQQKMEEAIAHFRAALAIDPNLPGVNTNLSWILATSPDKPWHNAAEAVHLAELACEQTRFQHPVALDSLAAAYAAAGRFPDAVETAQKARDLASATGQKSFVRDVEHRLSLYSSHRSYQTR